MVKSNQKYHRKRTRPFPWIPVVLGLALIGIAIVALASSGSKSEAADRSSVVPLEVHFAAPELSLQNLDVAAIQSDLYASNFGDGFGDQCSALACRIGTSDKE